MIAGAFDNISEEGPYDFANMKVTSSPETEVAMGREPTEMSRPVLKRHRTYGWRNFIKLRPQTCV